MISKLFNLSGARERMQANRAAREAREALTRDLAAFETQADLNELSAVLDRYDDKDTDLIRRSVDWSAAA